MNRRPLGSTGIRVSEIALGGWQLGGSGWGPTRKGELEGTVRRALELGIHTFDTAGVYGFGRSEELLGKVLRSSRDDCVVVSKGGLVWDERGRVRHDGSRRSLQLQIESSLQRLRRDTIDIYLLHWPDPAVPLSESAEALCDLVRSGKARAWGCANAPFAEVRAFASTTPGEPDRRSGPVLQYPWNLLHAHADEYREAAESGKIAIDAAPREPWGLLVFDVLARGILAGRYDESRRFGKRDVRAKDRRFRAPEWPRHLREVRALAEVARRIGMALPTLVVALSLRATRGAACIIGAKTPQQIEECARAPSVPLPDDVVRKWGPHPSQGSSPDPE